MNWDLHNGRNRTFCGRYAFICVLFLCLSTDWRLAFLYISSFFVNISFHTSNSMVTLDQSYLIFLVADSTDRVIVLEVDGEGKSSLWCSLFSLLLCSCFHPSFLHFLLFPCFHRSQEGDDGIFIASLNASISSCCRVLDLRFSFPLNPMVPQIIR